MSNEIDWVERPVRWVETVEVTRDNMLALVQHFAGEAYIGSNGTQVALNVGGEEFTEGKWVTYDGNPATPPAPAPAPAREPLKIGDRVRRVGPHTLWGRSDFGDLECEVGYEGVVDWVSQTQGVLPTPVHVTWDKGFGSNIDGSSLEVISDDEAES